MAFDNAQENESIPIIVMNAATNRQQENAPSDAVDAVPTEPIGWCWRLGLLLLWAVASFGTIYFSDWLARYRLGLWPLGYWLAAQGVIMLYVLIAAGYAWLANRHERLQDSRRGRGHEL